MIVYDSPATDEQPLFFAALVLAGHVHGLLSAAPHLHQLTTQRQITFIAHVVCCFLLTSGLKMLWRYLKPASPSPLRTAISDFVLASGHQHQQMPVNLKRIGNHRLQIQGGPLHYL